MKGAHLSVVPGDMYGSVERDMFSAYAMPYVQMSATQPEPKRTRIIVRLGTEYFVLPALQVMMFYTVNKIVFCITNTGKKYVVEGTNLNQLMEELPPQLFFRANRQVIINIHFIQSFKPIGNGRIQINMQLDIFQPIQVSQENASEFRRWVGQL
jgi:DNA-binding LytR/AlgR family response regulator